jgi:predicted DCC family thiol-disulfide oxidoreductase YuxK
VIGSADGPVDGGPVVLYDGVCGLCTRSIQVILAHDRRARFRFAALGGAFATRVLERHGYGPGRAAAPDALALVEGTGTSAETLRFRSDAICAIAARLPFPLRAAGWALRTIPRWLRDAVYDRIARVRHRVFGRLESCPVPAAEVRARFIDD